MNSRVVFLLLIVGLVVFPVQSSWAQARGHASVGLGHGEEGFLQLEEMIKHLEFSLKMQDADADLKTHGGEALKYAKEARDAYDKALKHANESLGRPVRSAPSMGEGSDHDMGDSPMYGGPGGGHSHEGSSHSHEGSGYR